MKVVSFVPIRLNNERLPGKNTLPLGNRPLCWHILSTLTSIDEIDEVYVFCSDDAIIRHLPPRVNFLRRDAKLDHNLIKGLELINSFVLAIEADIYIMSHATSPFIKPATIFRGLQAVKNEGYDSALSVRKFKTFAWHQGKPLNYNLFDFPRTQDIEPVYIETSGFYIFAREVFTHYRQRIGQKPYFVETEELESVDIDWQEDYEFAKLLYARNGFL